MVGFTNAAVSLQSLSSHVGERFRALTAVHYPSRDGAGRGHEGFTGLAAARGEGLPLSGDKLQKYFVYTLADRLKFV
jgi:hypothetical protein